MAACQHDTNNKIIFFYSKTCPHCEIVRTFLAANGVHNKIVFTEKEVSQNRHNLMQLFRIEQGCGMQVKDSVVVPLLWNGATCLTEPQKIIAFFKGKMRE